MHQEFRCSISEHPEIRYSFQLWARNPKIGSPRSLSRDPKPGVPRLRDSDSPWWNKFRDRLSETSRRLRFMSKLTKMRLSMQFGPRSRQSVALQWNMKTVWLLITRWRMGVDFICQTLPRSLWWYQWQWSTIWMQSSILLRWLLVMKSTLHASANF